MKRRLLIAGAAAALLLAGTVAAVVVLSRPGVQYPITPEGWAQRWVAAAEQSGRVPGENWDAWLDAAAQLERDDSPEAVAAAVDPLRNYPRFTRPVPEEVGTTGLMATIADPIMHPARIAKDTARVALADALQAGDLDGAADWAERVWTLARVVEGEGSVIGGMLQVSIVTTTLETVAPHLETVAADNRLRRLIAHPPRASVEWAVRAEREMGLPAISEMVRDGNAITMARDQMALYDMAVEDWLAYERTGDPAKRESYENLRTRLDNSRVYQMRRVLLDMLLMPLPHVSDSFRLGQGACDAAPVMLALEDFRRARGRYPDQLDELVPALLPAVPPDPRHADRPMGYRLIDPESADPQRAYALFSAATEDRDEHVFNQPPRRPRAAGPDPDPEPDPDPNADPEPTP